MQAIVHQLGELFLQAVPTVLIILAFLLHLTALFFQALAGRDGRARFAHPRAPKRLPKLAQAAAAEKVKQYQEALKQARGQGYASSRPLARNFSMNAPRGSRTRARAPRAKSAPKSARGS